MIESEQVEVRTYLETELQQFVKQFAVHADAENIDVFSQLESNCKQFADKVNSGLKSSFECLDDYKIVTIVSVSNPDEKSGGLSNASLWSSDTDRVINLEHRLKSCLLTVSVHFVLIPSDSSDEDSD